MVKRLLTGGKGGTTSKTVAGPPSCRRLLWVSYTTGNLPRGTYRLAQPFRPETNSAPSGIGAKVQSVVRVQHCL